MTKVPGHGYHLTVRDAVADIERDAANDVAEGRYPDCFFDLDVLAGDPPELDHGDQVRYRGNLLHVVAIEYDPTNGRRQLVVDLDPAADADDHTVLRLDERGDRYEVIASDAEDDRMPARFGVAKVLTAVVFDTQPRPAS